MAQRMPLGRFSFAADLILGLNMDLRTAVIIDVRSEGEYEMGHVPNSINIPLDAIPARIEEIKQMSPEEKSEVLEYGYKNWLEAQAAAYQAK